MVAWVRQPRHILTWACAPLALVHCAIAHKELRFLFPIAMLSPLLLALGLGVTVRRPWLRALAKGLLAYDLCGLVALSLLPAQPQVAFQRFVRHRFPQGLHAFVATPVSPWVRHGLTMYFYGPLPPDLRPWPGGAALDGEGVTRLDLIVFSWDAPPPTEPYTCRPIYRSIPAWLSRRGWPRSPSARPLAWDLLRCVVASHSATLGTSRWAPSRGGG